MSKFESRTHETHLSKANEWCQLHTKKEQDDFVKSHGVCWSILNNPDYWKPIDFCGIDVMHFLILGNSKDYCISFLKVGLAGHELELQRKRKSFLKDSKPSKYPLASLGNPRKRKNDDENDSQQMHRRKKQNRTKANLSHIWPCAFQWHQCSSEASRTKSDQTEKSKRTKISRTSTSRYSLRSQATTSTILNLLPFTNDRNSLVPSDCSSADNQDLYPIGDDTPRLKKVELEVLQKVITQTKVSSWFSHLPRKFGFKNFQTLKAAEWKILMTFYFPLALVPIWSLHIPHRDKRVKCSGNFLHKDLLLKSLISLVTLTNMLLKTSIHEEDLDKIERTTNIYCQTLCLGWSMINSKPNIHLTQNLPKVIKELGPPRSLAAWPYERMDHTFGNIPQNDKPC
ncbi:hypothetical protein O181_058977 [Austropuccinia psidii MF-1]|uniref:Uncharacterized protein n=1 Tax=Austropuccinia psidii MF-1 TaxID=1389203 RepID=A0A9Q3EFS6_9BASI|nr:hypothetical protein [Austropuccinia psidii MF-1]